MWGGLQVRERMKLPPRSYLYIPLIVGIGRAQFTEPTKDAAGRAAQEGSSLGVSSGSKLGDWAAALLSSMSAFAVSLWYADAMPCHATARPGQGRREGGGR